VSLAQLVWTMHKICKVRGSNPGHHQKKKKVAKKYKKGVAVRIKHNDKLVNGLLEGINYIISRGLQGESEIIQICNH